MHRLNVLLRVLTICLSHHPGSKRVGKKIANAVQDHEPSQDELILSLFVVAERLMLVNGKTALDKLVMQPISAPHWLQADASPIRLFSMHSPKAPSPNQDKWIPPEIVSLVFHFLKSSQKDVANASLVNKYWNAIGTRVMYDCPEITSVESFKKFLSTVTMSHSKTTRTTWPYHEMTNGLYFLPSEQGSLLESPSFTSDIINQVHSTLFRILTMDRGLDVLSGHPIFLHLLNLCPNLISIREKSKPGHVSKLLGMEGARSSIMRDTADESTWVISDFNLAQLLLATNRVRRICRIFIGDRVYMPSKFMKEAAFLEQGHSGLVEMKKLMMLIQRLIDSFLFLMELVDDDQESHLWDDFCRDSLQSPMSNERNIRTLEKARGIIFNRCRIYLNALSSTLLLQVQYITFSSQRLLDTYCLLYYKALSLANSLKTSMLLDILRRVGKHVLSVVSDIPAHQHLTVVFTEDMIPSIKLMQCLHALVQQSHRMHHHNEEPDQESLLEQHDPIVPIRLGDSSIVSPTTHTLETTSLTMEHIPGQPLVESFSTLLQEAQDPQIEIEGGEYLPLLLPDNSPHPTIQQVDTDMQHLSLHGDSSPDCNSTLSRAAQIWTRISPEDLRETFISLSPNNVNDESIEYVEMMMENVYISVKDEESEELSRVLKWLREVVLWQRANKQLEPVKDFLRQSMSRIDKLRDIQDRFGIKFLD